MLKSAPGVVESRVSFLNDKGVRAGGRFVLYWMQASVRTVYNYALEYAICQANKLQLPLVTVFGITDKYPAANERSYAFLLEGLADVAPLLRDKNIRFVCQYNSPVQAALQCSEDAAVVVTDMGYMPIQRAWRQELAERLECGLVEVESNVVIPVRVAYPKESFGARPLRLSANKVLPQFLVPLEQQAQVDISSLDLQGLHEDFDFLHGESSVQDALQRMDVDRTVPRVSTFRGGFTAGERVLRQFFERKMKTYDTQRNDVNKGVQSNMSPYLHFGHVSPVWMALEAMRSCSRREARDSFLEELIIRRELSMNFAWYNPKLETYDCLPDWARTTLDLHKEDKRPYLYTQEQLELAQTHDEYWNAAQIEMVLTGKMHNYMRMYWGKKVLEWTASPEEAFQALVYLNDRYELDGRDPNSYAGVAWCLGKHDQGWKERPVFGKVRYMNAGGLERKMDIGQYAAKWREKARQAGGLQAYLQQGGKKCKKVAGVKREASSSGAAQEGDLKRSKTR